MERPQECLIATGVMEGNCLNKRMLLELPLYNVGTINKQTNKATNHPWPLWLFSPYYVSSLESFDLVEVQVKQSRHA